MLEIAGERYLSTKEASSKFKFSKSWFNQRREKGNGPKFVKMPDGLIYYNERTIEQWFIDNMKERDKNDQP